jgi:hypothetical protein
MELETFISETLTSIIKGVKNAQDFAKENGARINPVRFNAPDDQYVFFGKEDGKKPLSIISFDVAVSISKSDEDKIGGGIKVLAFDLSGKTKSTNQNEVVSRIKFDIGAVLPFADGISDKPFTVSIA